MYPDDTQPEKKDSTPFGKEEPAIVNDKKKEEVKRGFRFWPEMKKKDSNGEEKKVDLSWMQDWADLLWLLPICVIGFISASWWIRKLDPTASVLSVENLTVLNFNLVIYFLGSGVMFVMWKIWVKGNIFDKKWSEGLTPYELMKIKLMFLGGLAIYTAFILTRNL